MKKLNCYIMMGVLAAMGLASCKKDKSEPLDTVRNTADFIAKTGPQKQVFTFSVSDLPKTISLKGGTKITFPENSLMLDGKPISGQVSVETLEMLKRSDVISGGANTNHVSGAPLISDGFIFIDVKSGGKSVDRQLEVPIEIRIPAKRDGGTQLWQGVVDDKGQFGWQAPGQGAGQVRDVKAVDGEFVFDFGQLGWINCDVFWSYSNPKTTLRVKVLNNPGTFATFRGFTGQTFVFFCAKGSNVAAQLYTPDGTDGVKSYDNMMPIGEEGRLIAFSIKDGRSYLAKKDITITEGLNETLTLTETTEAAIQTEINSMNGY